MTKLEQAARQLLVVLESGMIDINAVTALREALAEQEEQEPVAYLCNGARFKITPTDSDCYISGIPQEVGGRWVAFVSAENDCHLNTVSQSLSQKSVVLAWSNLEGTKFVGNANKWKHKDCVIPLYAAPVRTKDLTDDEIESIVDGVGAYEVGYWHYAFARAVIAADREKNRAL